MPKPTVNDPAHWRRRAAETRSIAAQLDDAVAKQAMLEIAEQYERVAAMAEKRAVADEP
jgi:hypothetical protein